MTSTLPLIATLPAAPSFSEVLQYVVSPGFALVVLVLSFLALVTQLIGVVMSRYVPCEASIGAAQGSESKALSQKEYAVVAAAVHAVLHSPNDLRKVAAAAAALHSSKEGKNYRIVSIEKK